MGLLYILFYTIPAWQTREVCLFENVRKFPGVTQTVLLITYIPMVIAGGKTVLSSKLPVPSLPTSLSSSLPPSFSVK